jgi:hypothetical protein
VDDPAPAANGRSRPNRIGRGWILVLIAGCALGIYALHNLPQAKASLPPSTNALGCCRAYCSAQSMFKHYKVNKGGEYAHPFPLLHSTPDARGNPLSLIDEWFAGATRTGEPKHCYHFEDMRTIAGQPIDWKNDYALCATPANHGPNRRFTLIVKTDGKVWAKDFGRSEFVTDFPANPWQAGWRDPEKLSFDEEWDSQVRWFFGSLLAAGALVAAFLLRASWWAVRALRGAGGESAGATGDAE